VLDELFADAFPALNIWQLKARPWDHPLIVHRASR
jgi:tRNA A37 threonylcarbamoyladenosine synthetase subunit TsaC/SUA5/YrdC